MWYWPKLNLTDYEKKFVDLYKTDKKPGVLRRVYNIQLANQAQPADNIPAAKLIDKYQIARRSRIFAITFSGNTDQWRLSVTNTNGTVYTNPAPRSQQFPVVTSIIAGSYYNALATGGQIVADGPYVPGAYTDSVGINPTLSNQFMSGVQNFPWLIEPNWVCQPNESIIFQGIDIAPSLKFLGTPDLTITLPTVLNISIYAWEFPCMSK
jgi:hypothetical protein